MLSYRCCSCRLSFVRPSALAEHLAHLSKPCVEAYAGAPTVSLEGEDIIAHTIYLATRGSRAHCQLYGICLPAGNLTMIKEFRKPTEAREYYSQFVGPKRDLCIRFEG